MYGKHEGRDDEKDDHERLDEFCGPPGEKLFVLAKPSKADSGHHRHLHCGSLGMRTADTALVRLGLVLKKRIETMNIMITSTSTSEYGKSIEMQTEKTEAYISKTDVTLQVICMNASAKCRRFNAGKVFHGDNQWEQAMEAYKSSAMKAMIELARSEMEAN